jgi:transposase
MQSLNGKSTADLRLDSHSAPTPVAEAKPSSNGQPGGPTTHPNPQVLEKATRRRFTARYKLRVLQETDGLPAGELGAYLRREGLYSSHLTLWRKQRESGVLAGLEPRARESKTTDAERALAKRVSQLEREKDELAERLRQAQLILDVQKKVLSLCESAVTAERRSHG